MIHPYTHALLPILWLHGKHSLTDWLIDDSGSGLSGWPPPPVGTPSKVIDPAHKILMSLAFLHAFGRHLAGDGQTGVVIAGKLPR